MSHNIYYVKLEIDAKAKIIDNALFYFLILWSCRCLYERSERAQYFCALKLSILAILALILLNSCGN